MTSVQDKFQNWSFLRSYWRSLSVPWLEGRSPASTAEIGKTTSSWPGVLPTIPFTCLDSCDIWMAEARPTEVPSAREEKAEAVEATVRVPAEFSCLEAACKFCMCMTICKQSSSIQGLNCNDMCYFHEIQVLLSQRNRTPQPTQYIWSGQFLLERKLLWKAHQQRSETNEKAILTQ